MQLHYLSLFQHCLFSPHSPLCWPACSFSFGPHLANVLINYLIVPATEGCAPFAQPNTEDLYDKGNPGGATLLSSAISELAFHFGTGGLPLIPPRLFIYFRPFLSRAAETVALSSTLLPSSFTFHSPLSLLFLAALLSCSFFLLARRHICPSFSVHSFFQLRVSPATLSLGTQRLPLSLQQTQSLFPARFQLFVCAALLACSHSSTAA